MDNERDARISLDQVQVIVEVAKREIRDLKKQLIDFQERYSSALEEVKRLEAEKTNEDTKRLNYLIDTGYCIVHGVTTMWLGEAEQAYRKGLKCNTAREAIDLMMKEDNYE